MTLALKFLTVLALTLLLTASHGFSVPAGSRRVPARRGDTRLEVFALDGALASVDNFFQTEPYLSAALTCSLKASVADWVAQSQAPQTTSSDKDKDTKYNLNRNLAFIAYGGLYQGCVQTFLFGVLFPLWFPGHDFQTIMTEVGIDILLLGPLVCMPTVYTMKALFAGEEPLAGIAKYVDHVQSKGILFKYWSLWGPVQALNFAIIPPHLRVFFVALVSFFWICFLSTVSSSTTSEAATARDAYGSSPSYPSLQSLRTVPIPVLSEAYEAQQQQQAFEIQRANSQGHPMDSAPVWARSTSS